MLHRRKRMGPGDLATRRNFMMRCATTAVRAAGHCPSNTAVVAGVPWNTRLNRCYGCTMGQEIWADRLQIVLPARKPHRKWRTPTCCCRAVRADFGFGSACTVVKVAPPRDGGDKCSWDATTWIDWVPVVAMSVMDAWHVAYNTVYRTDVAERVDDAIGVHIREPALAHLIAEYAYDE